jgi:outer membrane protein
MVRICILLFAQFMLVFSAVEADARTTYTLKQLCRLANESAETIKIANEDLYIAKQEKVRARSVLIPRATVYGRYLNYSNDDQIIPDTNTIGGMLTQSFTLNGRELIAYDVSKKGIEQAGFSREAVRSDYIFQVAQAYIQAISRERLVDVARSDMERLTAHKNSVQEKLKVGNVTKTALYRAEAELSRAKTDQIVADNDVKSAKASIVRLVGIEDGFDLAEDGMDKIGQFSTTPEQIQASALDRRYEIKAAKKAVEIARRTVSYEKGDYWPSLNLEGGYKESDLRYDTTAGRTKTDTESAYIQAELQFTLFDAGLRRAQVRQAMAKEHQAEHTLMDRQKQIKLQSKDAYLQFVTAKNTWINLKDEVKSAKENYNAVQMQFKYGMATSIDIMDANTLLVESERRLSNAEFNYYLSMLKIMYTQGDILDQLLSS